MKGYGGDDTMFGGFEDDKLEGGEGNDLLVGEYGDDKIFGGLGDDVIWGDDRSGPYGIGAVVGDGSGEGLGLMSGEDHIYGDEGADIIYGGQLADRIHGGEGDDKIFGEDGDDIIWGDAGKDIINAGYGWGDTVFGGPGCDTVSTYDGGDFIWLGDCEENTSQIVFIYGTGTLPTNYTVLMDFWLQGASDTNFVCPRIDK